MLEIEGISKLSYRAPVSLVFVVFVMVLLVVFVLVLLILEWILRLEQVMCFSALCFKQNWLILSFVYSLKFSSLIFLREQATFFQKCNSSFLFRLSWRKDAVWSMRYSSLAFLLVFAFSESGFFVDLVSSGISSRSKL